MVVILVCQAYQRYSVEWELKVGEALKHEGRIVGGEGHPVGLQDSENDVRVVTNPQCWKKKEDKRN